MRSSASNRQFVITRNTSSLRLEYWRGDAVTLLGTSDTPVASNTWYYLELHVLLSDTAGVVELRLNGETDLDLTGQNTLGDVSNPNFRQIDLLSHGTANIRVYFDDLCINDTTNDGSGNNSWTGDQAVRLIRVMVMVMLLN